MAPNPPFVAGGTDNPTAAKLNTGAYVYKVLTNEIDIVNSVTETDVLKDGVGTALSIGAGHMSTNRMLRATIHADYLNNSGSNKTFTLKVLFGGTVFYEDVTPLLDFSSASRQPIRIVLELPNLGSTNSQWLSGVLFKGEAGGATTGIGDLDTNFGWGSGSSIIVPFAGSGTIDTTVARNLEVKITHSAAHASTSFRKKLAIVELL